MRESVILSAVRTPTGKFLGVLKGFTAPELGAMVVRPGECETAPYREFGRHLGVAFQLTDDLLGTWGDPELTGKPVHADLAARKLTLPVTAAGLATDRTVLRGNLCAAAAIFFTLIVIFALLAHRHLIRGMTLGAVR